MREHDAGEARLLHAREARHVRVRQHVGRMLVVLRVLDRQPDLGEPRRPLEQLPVGVFLALGARRQRVVDHVRQIAQPFGLRRIDVVAAHELRHGDLAHVAMLDATEQVIEHAVAQRAFRHLHRLDAELVEYRAHDRHAAGQHRRAVRPQAADLVGIGSFVLDERRAQPLEALARQAFGSEVVLAQDVLHRARGARGADGLFPAGRAIGMRNARQLLARGQLGRLHMRLVDLAVGEILEAVREAAHVERFGELRIEAGADDELGRAAADVDDQPARGGGRHRVRHAEVDEARFLAAGDDLDREAEHRARLTQELRGILRDAQGVGADGAHALAREAAQPLGEFGQRLERRGLRGAVDALVGGEAATQAHHFAHRIERIDLAVDHAPDLEVEAVRAEVDRR